MFRGNRGCKTATHGLNVASGCALFGLVLKMFESVANIFKSNISHNTPNVHCDLKFQTFWHMGYWFLSGQFAVAEWQVLYSPPESHHFTSTLVASCLGPGGLRVGHPQSIICFSPFLLLYQHFSQDVTWYFLFFYQQNSLLLVYKIVMILEHHYQAKKWNS